MDTLQAELLEHVQMLLTRELAIPCDTVTQVSRLGHDSWWDSLGHLQILLMLAEEFGFTLTPDLARRLTSMSKIMDFLLGKK